jgi:hypothetical protein
LPNGLDGCAQRIHPLFSELFGDYPMSYLRDSLPQGEWLDIVFRDPEQLRYPVSTTHPSGHDQVFQPCVMRLMHKKVCRKGLVCSPNTQQLVRDLKLRRERHAPSSTVWAKLDQALR